MPCVIENTNPTQAERAAYTAPALAAGFEVVGYFFQATISDALSRNLLRPEARQVPERGVRSTRNRLEMPARAEDFDHLYFVRLTNGPSLAFDIITWQDEV